MTDFPALLRLLTESGVEFILVGGAAANAHGAPRLTLDLDVVYWRRSANNAHMPVRCALQLRSADNL